MLNQKKTHQRILENISMFSTYSEAYNLDLSKEEVKQKIIL